MKQLTADRTASDRVKRYRERLRKGIIFAHLEIGRSIGESMIELGYLPPEALVDDPKTVGDAFVRYWKEQYVRRATKA